MSCLDDICQEQQIRARCSIRDSNLPVDFFHSVFYAVCCLGSKAFNGTFGKFLHGLLGLVSRGFERIENKEQSILGRLDGAQGTLASREGRVRRQMIGRKGVVLVTGLNQGGTSPGPQSTAFPVNPENRNHEL